jgi:hypothetical protein
MPKTTGHDVKSSVALSPDAALRHEYAEHWVAWAEDFSRVVASGDTFESVKKAVPAPLADSVIFEWIPPIPLHSFGPGE